MCPSADTWVVPAVLELCLVGDGKERDTGLPSATVDFQVGEGREEFLEEVTHEPRSKGQEGITKYNE
jgi:hypothetical protein